MIVGIHQPNFIPSLSYFSKLMYSDIFIFLDSVQYIKENWTNRNRIKSPSGDSFLTVPVRGEAKSGQSIYEVKISYDKNWCKKHLNIIYNNYHKTPYYHAIISAIKESFEKEWEFLSDMNIYIIRRMCDILGIKRSFHVASELGRTHLKSTDLLIFLTKIVGGDTYLSGTGGKKYMNFEKFPENGLNLHFINYKPIPYRQQFGDFISNLSIIDLLFNEGPDALRLVRESAEVA